MRYIFLFLILPMLCIAQIPQYYLSVDFNQTGDNLKEQLTTLIINTHTTVLPYTSSSTTDVWDALKQTDLDPNNSNNVLLIYGWDDTNTVVNNDYSRDKTLSCHTSSCTGLWVREHVYPRSLGTPNLGYEFAGSDVHHLRSIDSNRNNSRSNRKFEEGTDLEMSYVTVAGNWYPGNEWKGDVARMMMYMYVRYPSQCLPTNVGVGSTSYSNFGDMPNVFLEWNAQDPVSEFELNRNNILQNLQGNRNPFIDNPYLATLIWNGPEATDSWNMLSISNNPLSNITLYPTVTRDIVYINNSNHHQYNYSVYNTLGQLISADITTHSIDLSNNNKGLYFIKVNLENQTKTFKIILN